MFKKNQSSIKESAIIKQLEKNINQFIEDIEFPVAPQFCLLLWHFISKLYFTCRQRNIKKLFFLSREGFFLKLLFELYQQHYASENTSLVTCNYLLVSRRATAAASLRSLALEDFRRFGRRFHSLKRRRSLKDFSMHFSLPIDEMRMICQRLNINFEKRIRALVKSEIFNKLKQDNYFQKMYEEHSYGQRLAFDNYINSFDLKSGETIYLVDVGWKGTIQDNLCQLLNHKHTIVGLYIGLRGAKKSTIQNEKVALLFNLKSRKQLMYLPGNALDTIELLLSADHGSVKGYYYDKKTYKTKIIIEDLCGDMSFYNTEIFHYQKKIYDNFLKLISIFSTYGISFNFIEKFLFHQYAKIFIFTSEKDKAWRGNKFIVDELNSFEKIFLYTFPRTKFKKVVEKFYSYRRWFHLWLRSIKNNY